MRPRVNRLLQIADNIEIVSILGDITKTDNNYVVGNFMNQFDNNTIDAWQLMNIYNQPERRINNPILQKVKVLQDDNDFVSKIGGANGLAEIIAKNKRASYKGCTNCNATYLRDIDEYLDDVKDFVSKYSSISGYDKVLSSGLKNASPNSVEASAFMLRVLGESVTSLPINSF